MIWYETKPGGIPMTATEALPLPLEHQEAVGVQPLMLELWQTEWCPASRRVRQRLTELGLDYVARQVPVEREDRAALQASTGTDTIPVLVAGSRVLCGEERICAWLDAFTEPAGAA